jgi:hypothetical protein
LGLLPRFSPGQWHESLRSVLHASLRRPCGACGVFCSQSLRFRPGKQGRFPEHPGEARDRHRLRRKAEAAVEPGKNVPQGLNRLRKNSKLEPRCEKTISQRLKPEPFCRTYWHPSTSLRAGFESVPFQNSGFGEFFRSL